MQPTVISARAAPESSSMQSILKPYGPHTDHTDPIQTMHIVFRAYTYRAFHAMRLRHPRRISVGEIGGQVGGWMAGQRMQLVQGAAFGVPKLASPRLAPVAVVDQGMRGAVVECMGGDTNILHGP